MYPCGENCLYYPGDANYEEKFDEWLLTNYNFAVLTESVQDTGNYKKPLSVGVGEYYRLFLSRKTIGKTRIFLKQIIVRTEDGFISKTAREDVGLVTSDGFYSKSSRVSEN